MKYKNLLNNLLRVNSKDKSIFFRINNTDSFDIYSKFGLSAANSIFTKKNFQIKNIKDADYEELIKDLKNVDNPFEIIKLYDSAKEKLSVNNKLLLDNFQKILSNYSDKNYIYKRFKKIINKNIENNMNIFIEKIEKNKTLLSSKDLNKKKSLMNFENIKLINGIRTKLNLMILENLKEKEINKIIDSEKQRFFELKNDLIESLELKLQKAISRWKIFRRKIIDLNTLHNIWPLHIATFFIELRSNDNVIYGPLLLKEVNIEIDKNQKINIISYENDWKINEKLIFSLNKSGFNLSDNFDFKEKSANECVKEIFENSEFNFDVNNFNFIDNFKNLNKEEIKTKTILIKPGIVLGLFNPSGSNLRKAMIEIIDENKIDEILDPDHDKSIYRKEIENFIINKSKNLIRIQSSNYSQDKALISSLIQDTVIWGPPGTGKSQVIVNLISNILYNEKTAIIVSEKKAALDVIKNRLGKLSSFVLFFLNSNNNKFEKTEFYKILNDFVFWIEEFDLENFNKNLDKSKMISKDEIEFLDLIKLIKKEKKYDYLLKILEIFGDKFDIKLYKKIKSLNLNLKYPNSNLNFKEFINKLIKINKIKKIKKEYSKLEYSDSFLKTCKNIYSLMNNEFKDLDLNEIINIKKSLNNENFLNIYKNINFLNLDIFNQLKKLDQKFIYSNKFNLDYEDFIQNLAKINKIQKKNLFLRKKYPKSFLKNAFINYELLKEIQNKNLDINHLIKIFDSIDYKTYEYIYKNQKNLNDKTFLKLDNIDINLKYLDNFDLNYKDFINNLAEINKIEKISKSYFKKEYSDELLKNFENINYLLTIDEIKKSNFNNLIKFVKSISFDEFEKLIFYNNKIAKQKISKMNEEDLINILAFNIKQKINKWKIWDKENYSNYKKFAKAVRSGRRLPYKFIDSHKLILKELFPVIVSTPETLDIDLKNKYDYVIMDESSQIFIEIGLPILYLGKIRVLAGDNMQMKPSSWFIKRESINDEDEDISEDSDSILNYALEKGVNKVMLNQNYRSKRASLMSFSAKNFYNSELEVINQNDKNKNKAIIVKNIKGKWNNGINEEEATEIINILLEKINNYKSIIVLTFNKKQEMLIKEKIYKDYKNLEKLIDETKIVIRNIENVQGDEANLVIISVVYDLNTKIHGTYVVREGGANALNVAISRAIDKLIIIKSIYGRDLTAINSSYDYQIFQKWLDFLDMKEKDKVNYSMKNNKILESYGEEESNFERNVIDQIKEKLFVNNNEILKLVKQYEVGSKRIDIALLNDNNKFILGIEVDGYKYHEGKGIDKYLEDISREEFLEAKGYKIFRIKELDWTIDKDKVLRNLENILNSEFFSLNN